jgi:hypothetical protein
MAKYRKAAAFVGKDLSLNIGRSDMRIEDGREYDNPKLAKFVPLGMMEVVPEESSEAAHEAETVVPPPSEPPPKAPAAKKPEALTKAELNGLTKADLVKFAKKWKLELDPGMLKADMVTAILKAQKK